MAKRPGNKPRPKRMQAAAVKAAAERAGGIGPNAARKGKNWKAPADMTRAQEARVRAGRECGARLAGKRGPKSFCTREPAPGQREIGRLPPYRCESHGATRMGAPKGNARAVTCGIYSNALLPGEADLVERLPVDSVDDEIRVTKLRLRRALAEERKQREAQASGKLREQMREAVREARVGHDGRTEIKTTRQLRDMDRVIDRIVSQLARLIQQKVFVESNSSATTPGERARLAREALEEAKREVGL